MPEPHQPYIERTPFEPLAPPQTVTLWFCPACGQRITGSYNIDPAKKKCTKTWHLTAAVEQKYEAARWHDEAQRLRNARGLAQRERDAFRDVLHQIAYLGIDNGADLKLAVRLAEEALSDA